MRFVRPSVDRKQKAGITIKQGASVRDKAPMNERSPFSEFVETIAVLRAPNGCPWDRKQTHSSIAQNMLEEAYEAVDAIEDSDTKHLREELGDVLLQVVLQSQIAKDAGEFTIDDVCRDINEKMIRRHPHVFGDAEAEEASDVVALWDSIKLGEQAMQAKQSSQNMQVSQGVQALQHTQVLQVEEATNSKQAHAAASTTSTKIQSHTPLLEGVPAKFPALMQAQKISRKVVSVGFEWETLDAVWAQVFAEIDELKEAYATAQKDSKGKVSGSSEVELEMGDVLFSLVNVARKMGIDAESALRASCKKFRNRWVFIEGAAWARGIDPEQLSLEEMEEYWNQAKQTLK